MAKRTVHPVEVDGHELTLSNLDKVLYPKAGFTKGEVIDYYVRASPVLLPHLEGRALSLKRYPDGVEAPFFYQKSCPEPHPDFLKTAKVWSDGRGDDIDYCTARDLASLVWLVNMGDLELHTFLGKAKEPLKPTMMVYDLDPGQGAGLLECCKVGLLVRERLAQDGLEAWIKVSGSKGMQLYVPLNTPTDFDSTKLYARRLADELMAAHPKLITSNMRKDLRKGRVFIDWSQNDDHKTTVCVYSLRGTAKPQVSMPVEWDEVQYAAETTKTEHLVFTPQAALERIDEVGDLFAPVLTEKQRLPKGKRSAAA